MEYLVAKYKIREYLKCIIKSKKFKRYAQIGKSLSICSISNCDAEKPGLIKIGDYCTIRGRLESQGEGRIQIGSYTGIFDKSVIGSVSDITIGSYVMISNHVHIYDNNNHPVSPVVRH